MPYTSLNLTNNQFIKDDLYSQLYRFNEAFDRICHPDAKPLDDMSDAEIDLELNRLLETKRYIERLVPQTPIYAGELILTVDEDHSILETINTKEELIFMYRNHVINTAKALAFFIQSLKSKIEMIEYFTNPSNNIQMLQLHGILVRIHNQKSQVANAGEFSYTRQAELQRHLPFSTDLVGTSEDIILYLLLQQLVIQNEIRDRHRHERDIIDESTQPAKKFKTSK